MLLFFNQIYDENLATGAGHGAPGGSPSADYTGGDAYDLTRDPTEVGSGGGNSVNGTGGTGGGYLQIFTYYDLTNDGKLLPVLKGALKKNCIEAIRICLRQFHSMIIK